MLVLNDALQYFSKWNAFCHRKYHNISQLNSSMTVQEHQQQKSNIERFWGESAKRQMVGRANATIFVQTELMDAFWGHENFGTTQAAIYRIQYFIFCEFTRKREASMRSSLASAIGCAFFRCISGRILFVLQSMPVFNKRALVLLCTLHAGDPHTWQMHTANDNDCANGTYTKNFISIFRLQQNGRQILFFYYFSLPMV